MTTTASTTASDLTGPRVNPAVVTVGLLLAYLPVWLPPMARELGINLSSWGPAAVIIWNWLAVVLLAAHVGLLERQRPHSLRLIKPTEKDLEWAGYLGGAALVWQWLTSLLVPAMEAESGGAGALVALGPLVALALVVTVAITEEVLWRGYVVERLGAWIGLWPAAGLGLLIFAAGHVPFFGAWWLVTNLPGAVLLYALLVWRRNLWACILCHLILDIPIVLLALFA